MKQKQWRYKIGGGAGGLIPLLVMLAVFGGVSVWLYLAKNGAFLFTGIFTALLLAIMAYSVYRLLFVKVLFGEDGFFHQTRPGNGKYYAYGEISEAWESAGKNSGGVVSDTCSYRTVEGTIVKFPFSAFEADGIDFFLAHVNGEGDGAGAGEDSDE